MKYMLEKTKLEMIQNATASEINDMLIAMLERYRELYPDWEFSFFTVEPKKDKNEQLDEMIAMLEKQKEK